MDSGFPIWIAPAVLVAFYLLSSIKVLNEYERGVVFRLGKLLPEPKGPGVILVFAPLDKMVRVSLRTIVMDVPPQDVITRDNVSVKVNAVVYFRVMDPRRAIVEVESYHYATSQLAQTTLRSVLGQAELDDLLAERDRLNAQLQQILLARSLHRHRRRRGDEDLVTLDDVERGHEAVEELVAFCRERLAAFKCPRSVDFRDQLPRYPTGKLYKRLIRDAYWGKEGSRIV